MLSRVWFPGLILVFFIILLVNGSLELTADAMIFPWIVGGLGSIMLFSEIIGGVMEARRRTSTEAERGRAYDKARSFLAGVAWIVAILPMIYLLGLSLTIPLYLILYLKLHREKWVLSIMLTSVTGVFFYIVFVRVLKVSFYEGLLLSYILG